jgi:hypothetical protein
MVIKNNEYSNYQSAKKYFITRVSNDELNEILKACIADFKRILISTYIKVKDNVGDRRSAKEKINNHYNGVFFNIVLKAFKNIVHESALNSKAFKSKIDTFYTLDPIDSFLRSDIPELIDISFVKTNEFDSAHPLSKVLEYVLSEISIANVKPSQDTTAPYIALSIENKIQDIYEELILENA